MKEGLWPYIDEFIVTEGLKVKVISLNRSRNSYSNISHAIYMELSVVWYAKNK